ncbi:MAG: hypothetical protein HY556_07355 [Euryarchaeota archaeon]|nr:hypothetical protein [Euryarchaeota archaeon]
MRRLAVLVVLAIIVAPGGLAAEDGSGAFLAFLPAEIRGPSYSEASSPTLYLHGDRDAGVSPEGAFSAAKATVTLFTVKSRVIVSPDGVEQTAIHENGGVPTVETTTFGSAILRFSSLLPSPQYRDVPAIQVLFYPSGTSSEVTFEPSQVGYISSAKDFTVRDPMRAPDAVSSQSNAWDFEHRIPGEVLAATGNGRVTIEGATDLFVFGASFTVGTGTKTASYSTGKTFTDEGPVREMTRSWATLRLEGVSGTLETKGLDASLLSNRVLTSVDGEVRLGMAEGSLETPTLLFRTESARPVTIMGVFQMESGIGEDGRGDFRISGSIASVSWDATMKPAAATTVLPSAALPIGVLAVGVVGIAAYMGARRGSLAGAGLWTFSLRKKQQPRARDPSPEDALNSQDFVFANEVRALAYELVEKRAGLTKREIVSIIGKAEAAAEVEGLVAKGLILRRAAPGGERYFFPMRQVEENFERIAYLRSDKASRVAEIVLLYGIIPAEDVEAAGGTAQPRISAREVRRILGRLESLGLVRLLDEGAKRMVEPTLALQECLELMGTAIPEARIRDYSS